ncbi:MAG: hypothetical protein KA366_07010 [Hydromonas sp.]|nr:hypothetical protein [Hydromonas sp.]
MGNKMKRLCFKILGGAYLLTIQGCAHLPMPDVTNTQQQMLLGTWHCLSVDKPDNYVSIRSDITKTITLQNIHEEGTVFLSMLGFMGDFEKAATSEINASVDSKYELDGNKITSHVSRPIFKVIKSSSPNMSAFTQMMFDMDSENEAIYKYEIVELNERRLILKNSKSDVEDTCTR